MSTAVVDNKGLEAPSSFKTFMKNNMRRTLSELAVGGAAQLGGESS